MNTEKASENISMYFYVKQNQLSSVKHLKQLELKRLTVCYAGLCKEIIYVNNQLTG